jgi:hypothetical protein
MKARLFGLVAALALLGVSQAAADTMYYVSDSYYGEYVNGTITTDGNLGVLGSADITAWNLTISGDVTTPVALTSSNSTLGILGNDLTATSTTLSFNYSDTAAGSITIFNRFQEDVGYLDVGVEYLSLGAVQSGFSGGIFYIPYFYCPAIECGVEYAVYERFGTQIIGIKTIDGTQGIETPLPAALPLFATGLGALGLLGWRRKRKAAAAA